MLVSATVLDAERDGCALPLNQEYSALMLVSLIPSDVLRAKRLQRLPSYVGSIERGPDLII